MSILLQNSLLMFKLLINILLCDREAKIYMLFDDTSMQVQVVL